MNYWSFAAKNLSAIIKTLLANVKNADFLFDLSTQCRTDLFTISGIKLLIPEYIPSQQRRWEGNVIVHSRFALRIQKKLRVFWKHGLLLQVIQFCIPEINLSLLPVQLGLLWCLFETSGSEGLLVQMIWFCWCLWAIKQFIQWAMTQFIQWAMKQFLAKCETSLCNINILFSKKMVKWPLKMPKNVHVNPPNPLIRKEKHNFDATSKQTWLILAKKIALWRKVRSQYWISAFCINKKEKFDLQRNKNNLLKLHCNLAYALLSDAESRLFSVILHNVATKFLTPLVL